MPAHLPTLVSELQKSFGEMAGQDFRGSDPSLSFLELGLDSLLLTQAAAIVKSRFGVKVTFRQLNDDLASFERLATYIGSKLPDEAPAPAAPAVVHPDSTRSVVPVAPVGSTPPGSALERIMQEQLRLMELQLSVLRRKQGVDASVPIETTPAPAPAPVGAAAATATAEPVAHGPFRQLVKRATTGFTAQQQAHLEWLTGRYLEHTPASREYTRQHRPHFADPRAVAGFHPGWKEMVYPIVSTRSSGAHLWDLDGNRWVDVTMGFGVALLGHSPDFVTRALQRQLELGVEIGPQSPLAGDVARAITELTGMERVSFCNTGSEAVMAAIRLCRTVTGRTQIALFAGAYHGTFDEVLVRGTWREEGPHTLPLAPGVAPNLVSEVTVLEYGSARSLEWIRAHAGRLAAVLVEPVQSRHPGLQPREFLQELRQLTRAADTPLILDEVITGFRCHPGGAQAYFGIEADLVTYGKVIGGGMPLGVVAGRRELMDALDGGQWQYGDASCPEVGVTFFAGTFVRHPLAMAAAKVMLERLREAGPELQQGLADRTASLIDGLNDYFRRHGVPLELERFTSIWYPHFGSDVKHGSLLYTHLREKGLHIWEGRPCFLSTAHSAEDVAFIVHAFKQSVAEMQAGGFLGGSSEEEFTAAASRAGVPVAAPDSAPLTEAQKEVWLASQLNREASCSFVESCALRLDGELDELALCRAIREIVQRHEALRSVFGPAGDRQTFASALPLEIARTDYSGLENAERNRRLEALLAGQGLRHFDLEQGPLVSWEIVRLRPREHVLVFTVHHIACDGWSYDVVLHELSQLYSAYATGGAAALPKPTSFSEFVAWEKEQRESPAGRASEQWWVEQLTPLPEPLELPGDRPRPAERSFGGARQARPLPPGLGQALRAVGARHGATLHSVLLAAFGALLHRLSSRTDLVIGVPVAGQNWMDRECLVGHCANLLPLRLDVEPDRSFAELLQRVKAGVLDAFDRQGTTFGTLVERLNPPRDPSRPPLAAVMFNVDPPLARTRFAGLEHAITLNPRRGYQFDLGINVVEAGGTLVVECDYSTDLFAADTIERWLGHYETLLAAAAGVPATPVRQLPLLEPAAQAQLMARWNGPAFARPIAATFLEAFAEQTHRRPDAAAVTCRGITLSYRELDQRSSQLAHHLVTLGVRPGTLAGVCIERSIEMVVAVLGILKAGGAYVPVDPGFPRERIALMLADADAPVLLTQAALLPGLPPGNATVFCLDRDWDRAARMPRTPPAVFPGVDDLAYVIYTSGSTGRPKGVEISHGALVNFLESMRDEPGLAAEDVLLAVTTLSFDIAGLELFLPLITGAQIVLAPREAVLDPHRLKQLMAESGATVMQATPATWRMLADSDWIGNPHLKALCGGEALPPDLAARLLGRCAEVWNLYGPTETTIWSTLQRVQPDVPVSLGRPIANTRLYVVDAQLGLRPPGIPGELLIGGAGLARGYRGQPELTRGKFIPDPFRSDGRVYRTGDLVRWTAGGELEFLGRMDHQVKIRGHRIELGDVESSLLSHPKVREAVVVAAPDPAGGQRLVAYVAPHGAEPSSVNRWGEVWDSLFRKALQEGLGQSATLGNIDSIIFGWTAGPQDQAEVSRQVEEWIATTVARITGLRPSRVLELGCGTGQLLLRLAPQCQEYWGTDIAATAIKALQQQLAGSDGRFSHVTLQRRAADEFDGIPTGHFDTVVINSVSQYFPHVEHLARVVEGAIQAVQPGGRVFVGDVQSFALMECYRTAAELERLPPETPVDVLRSAVQRRIAAEDELMVDPDFFHRLRERLPQLAHVEIQLRRGVAINETTQFHYDAVLHLAPVATPVPVEVWHDWDDTPHDPAGLATWLRNLTLDAVGIRGVPNRRLQQAVAALELVRHAGPGTRVGEIRQDAAQASQGIDPEAIWQAGEAAGFETRVCWADRGTAGKLEVSFVRRRGDERPLVALAGDSSHGIPWSQLANVPARGAPAEFTGELRQALKEHLPDYMVPSAFVVLPSLPRTPNDKIDRRALPPAPATLASNSTAHEPPATEREQKLATLWSELLGVPDVGVTDNFFDLGGHSLLAVNLFARIEREFGVRLPLATLYRAQTIREVAASIPTQAANSQVAPCLVAIQPRGTKPAVFFVHGAGGNVLLYRQLAQELGGDQPFYGLQSRGLDDSSPLLTSIEEMAAYYLREIRAVQPHGPYHLGGYCMGGTVAYEMAQQLAATGERVGCLALLDTYNFALASTAGSGSALRQRLGFHLRNLAGLPLRDAARYVKEKLRIARDGELRSILRHSASPFRSEPNGHPPGESAIQTINEQAATVYVPRPYPGRLTVFKPGSNYDFYPDPHMGWDGLAAGGLEVVDLQVNPHAMLMHPHVIRLAQSLQRQLASQSPSVEKALA